MTLSKAIQILDLNIKVGEEKMPPDVLVALKLGIEALKRELKFRRPQFKGHIKLLPGETEG